MDWEDCVVDVHSVKLSRQILESMFKKCGPIRSITHWKGQGEKPHIFFEYKMPSSTNAARTVGLDRSDLQVIKLSNNEMLKKKFRELAHGPLRDRPTSRSAYPYSTTRDTVGNATGMDHRLPRKPAPIPSYVDERRTRARYDNDHSESVRERDIDIWSSRSGSVSSFSNTRSERLSPLTIEPARASTLDSVQQSSNLVEASTSRAQAQNQAMSRDFVDGREGHDSHGVNPTSSRSYPLTPQDAAPRSPKRSPSNTATSPAIIEIPHAGEIIKFDLNSQLEDDPAGIIRILTAVKADQKLWMMTAAHYNGKRNLESAKMVLEAGIEMAGQVGEGSDTKPFWYLLGQINNNFQVEASTTSSVLSASPTTSFFDRKSDTIDQPPPQLEQLHSYVTSSPATEAASRLTAIIPHDQTHISSPVPCSSESSKNRIPDVAPLTLPRGTSTLLPLSRPTGPRKRDSSSPPTSPPVPPSGPMGTTARIHSLQSEIGALREKQNAVLEDLSFARAAKRRAEDEVKEERSVRRKLEKHLKATEDALSRSKRMEDAALDQVKREVDARRKAEALLADTRARKDRVEGAGSSIGGSALFSHPNAANDAAVLFHLASMIRGVQSGDFAPPYQLGGGSQGSDMTRTGGSELTNETQSQT